jgi:hypothetical protein
MQFQFSLLNKGVDAAYYLCGKNDQFVDTAQLSAVRESMTPEALIFADTFFRSGGRYRYTDGQWDMIRWSDMFSFFKVIEAGGTEFSLQRINFLKKNSRNKDLVACFLESPEEIQSTVALLGNGFGYVPRVQSTYDASGMMIGSTLGEINDLYISHHELALIPNKE